MLYNVIYIISHIFPSFVGKCWDIYIYIYSRRKNNLLLLSAKVFLTDPNSAPPSASTARLNLGGFGVFFVVVMW